jgi:preprotein translocase SecF subunit
VVALIHDVIITVGVFCLLGRQLSVTSIAAILTIIGWSVNDTIVVFDRIRENVKLYRGKPFAEVANLSLNQTLSRTLLTSLTTLISVAALLIFGGGAINDFALMMFVGIIIGTYSSIAVATPIAMLWHPEKKLLAKEKTA